jgi:hypothetical protein
VNEHGKSPDGFDDEELIRSEFDSIVSGLSLDESTPNTYLDDLERAERQEGLQKFGDRRYNEEDGFAQPNPPRANLFEQFRLAKNAIKRWFNRPYREDDGVNL